MQSIAAVVIVALAAIIAMGVVAVLLVIPRNAKVEIDAQRRYLKIDTKDQGRDDSGER